MTPIKYFAVAKIIGCKIFVSAKCLQPKFASDIEKYDKREKTGPGNPLMEPILTVAVVQLLR